MKTKSDYIQTLETQINQAQKTLNDLKNRKEQVIEQAQHEEIERLEQYLDQAQVKLKNIYEAAAESWFEFKEDMDQLLQNIRESLQKLLQH